jgi:hypothetical protein
MNINFLGSRGTYGHNKEINLNLGILTFKSLPTVKIWRMIKNWNDIILDQSQDYLEPSKNLCISKSTRDA